MTSAAPMASAIAAVAVVLRLAAVCYLHDWTDPERWEYGIITDNLAAGKGFSGSAWFVPEGPTAFMAPGYVFLLYGAKEMFGSWGYALLQCAQALAGGASVVLLSALTRRAFGPATALGAAALLALHPVHIYLAAVMHPAVFTVFALLLILEATARFADRADAARAVSLGLACGAAALLDPLVVCLAPAIALAPFVAAPERWRRTLGYGCAAALCAAAAVAPWTIRNYLALGHVVPVKSPVGYLLWVGNHPGANGTLLYVKDDGTVGHVNDHAGPELRAELRDLGEPEAYRRLGEIARAHIAAEPLAAAGRTMRKAVYYWVYPYWLIDPADAARPWLAHVRRPQEVLWMAILAAAAYGAWRERKNLRKWPAALLLVAPLLCLTALYAVTNLGAGPRYRLPAETLVLAFAAAGLLHAVPARWTARIAAGLAVLIAAPAFAQEAPPQASLRWMRGRVAVEVTIDGKGPYPFLLDSAAPMLVIDETVAEDCGVRIHRDTHIAMPAADGALAAAYHGRFNSAYAGGLRLGVDEAAVTDLSAHAAWIGEPVAGIVGLPHFGGAVAIDMGAARLRLAELPPAGEGIALTPDGAGFLRFNAVCNGSVPLPAVLDLGFGGLLALPEETANAKKLLGAAPILRVRDGGLASAAQTRLASLLVGAVSFDAPIVDLWPTGERARFGCAVLQTHALHIAADQSRMWFAPRSDAARTAAAPLAGLGVIPDRRDGEYWTVRVIADSPADRAGLQTGDRLVAVDGLSLASAHYPAAAAALSAEPGRTRSLDLLRSGNAVRLEVTAQTLL